MINQISENIWQFDFSKFGSCVYIIKLKNRVIMIDTSSKENKEELIQKLKEINLTPQDIDLILLTHNHFDHVGNMLFFKYATLYGHKKDFKYPKILDIHHLNVKEIKIIDTPGHTRGGICIYLPKEKILFSGDTLFHNGIIGRTDFENSLPEEMQNSLNKLKQINYQILCPGHI